MCVCDYVSALECVSERYSHDTSYQHLLVMLVLGCFCLFVCCCFLVVVLAGFLKMHRTYDQAAKMYLKPIFKNHHNKQYLHTHTHTHTHIHTHTHL